MKKRLKIYKSSSQAVKPIAPTAKNNVTKAHRPGPWTEAETEGRRTDDRQQKKKKANERRAERKGNLTNKTEVNLLRKPKSMAQPHPVKRGRGKEQNRG